MNSKATRQQRISNCRLSNRRNRTCAVILLTAVLSYPGPAFSASAKVFIHPTLVELSDGQRSTTVNVVNQGDATGVFTIDWVDYMMTEDGRLVVHEGDAPWSLRPHTRYSPRRVTLRPGETQRVKLALRRGADVPEGEYYSHLKVLTLNDNVDVAAEKPDAEAATTHRTLTVRARTAVAVPVIWRNSRTKPLAVIETARFDPELHELSVHVSRVGLLSTRGYLHVIHTAADGARRTLADPTPFVIYPSVERRIASITIGADAIDPAGQLEVVYSTEKDLKNAKSELASYRLVL